MLLEESLEVIIGVIRQKTEDRMYFSYSLNMLFADKKNQMTYYDFLKKQGFINNVESNKKVDINKVRNKANNVVERLKAKIK